MRMQSALLTVLKGNGGRVYLPIEDELESIRWGRGDVGERANSSIDESLSKSSVVNFNGLKSFVERERVDSLCSLRKRRMRVNASHSRAEEQTYFSLRFLSIVSR